MDDFPPRKSFNDMMQNPRVAFRDPALRGVTIERDQVGLPRPRAGAFADVYRAVFPDKRSTAIRVFASYQPERQERYKAISEHLAKHPLPSLVPFTYADEGVRAMDGRWYPLITMEWVQGSTLFDWLDQRAGARDQKSLSAVASGWHAMIQGLTKARIAHGDLQHANVMITDSCVIKLVDYDGMCVPALVGRKNLEIGVEPYQHPGRDGNTPLTPALDNFSSTMIYVGLRALAADPQLWQEFVVRPMHDKILFQRQDFVEPGKSPLFQRLRKSPDGEVQRLSVTLGELTRVRIDQVPCLQELLTAFDFGQVRSALDRRDFDAAVGLLTRNRKQTTEAPVDLQTRIRDAQQRAAKLSELVAAVDGGNESAMVGIAGSPLLKDYPNAADALAVAKDAPAAAQIIRRLEAARAERHWRDLVREWDAGQAILTKPKGSLRRSAQAFRADVESWRVRNALCDEVVAAIRSPRPDAAALLKAWSRLKGLGGHPECDTHRAAVERCLAAAQPAAGPATFRGATVASPVPRAGGGSRPAPLAPTPMPQPSSRTPVSPIATPTTPTNAAPQPLWSAGTVPVQAPTTAGGTPPIPAGGAVPSGQVRSPLQTATTHFMIELGRSIGQGLCSWFPPARWIRSRVPWQKFDDAAIGTVLACMGVMLFGCIVGSFVGALCSAAGDKWMPFRGYSPEPIAWLTIREATWSVPLAVAAMLTLVGWLNHDRGRHTFGWRSSLPAALFAMACGIAAAATGVVVHAAMQSLIRDGSSPWIAAMMRGMQSISTYAVLTGSLMLAMGPWLPNVPRGRLILAGASIGVITGLLDASVPTSNELVGHVVAGVLFGPLLGAGLGLVEAASRDWFLEVETGRSRRVRLSIGSSPVAAGTDPLGSHVLLWGIAHPAGAKYWLDGGQPYVLDLGTGQPSVVAAGDRRVFGSAVLRIGRVGRAILPPGSRGATAVPAARLPPTAVPPATTVPGGGRPVVSGSRPATTGAVEAAPGSRPATPVPTTPPSAGPPPAAVLRPPPPPPPPRTPQ
jgi:hypothetical protein